MLIVGRDTQRAHSTEPGTQAVPNINKVSQTLAKADTSLRKAGMRAPFVPEDAKVTYIKPKCFPFRLSSALA